MKNYVTFRFDSDINPLKVTFDYVDKHGYKTSDHVSFRADGGVQTAKVNSGVETEFNIDLINPKKIEYDKFRQKFIDDMSREFKDDIKCIHGNNMYKEIENLVLAAYDKYMSKQ